MEVFDGLMYRYMMLLDIFYMIFYLSEFENIVFREDEIFELEILRRNRRVVLIDIKVLFIDKVGKVNLFL